MNWIEFIAFVFCTVLIGGGLAALALDCLDDLIGIYQQRKQDRSDDCYKLTRNNHQKYVSTYRQNKKGN